MRHQRFFKRITFGVTDQSFRQKDEHEDTTDPDKHKSI